MVSDIQDVSLREPGQINIEKTQNPEGQHGTNYAVSQNMFLIYAWMDGWTDEWMDGGHCVL